MRSIVFIIVIIIWVIASIATNLNEVFLPDALSLISKVADIPFLLGLVSHTLTTFARVLFGTGTAVVIGVPLAILLIQNPAVKEVVEPMLDFLRGIPISMMFPLFIVFVGYGELSRSLIVLTLALPIIVTSILISSRPTPDNQERIDYFRLRSSNLIEGTKTKMVLWEALPGLVTGLRLSLSLGIVIVIVTEMFFVASSGIGWLAFRAYERFEIDEMYLYILVAGLASISLNTVIKQVERIVQP